VVAVGETPEKKLKQNTSQPHRSELTAQTKSSQFLVADTMSSSLDAANNRDSQRKKPDSKVTGNYMNVFFSPV